MAWVMTAVREPGHGSGPPGRHRELFPLPLVESSFMRDHVCGKASRTVRLRVARREQRLSLCNKVISSLNLLYDGRGARHTITSTNVAQRESLSRLLQAVDAFGAALECMRASWTPLPTDPSTVRQGLRGAASANMLSDLHGHQPEGAPAATTPAAPHQPSRDASSRSDLPQRVLEL